MPHVTLGARLKTVRWYCGMYHKILPQLEYSYDKAHVFFLTLSIYTVDFDAVDLNEPKQAFDIDTTSSRADRLRLTLVWNEQTFAREHLNKLEKSNAVAHVRIQVANESYRWRRRHTVDRSGGRHLPLLLSLSFG